MKACIEAKKLVNEECFEITVDSHGIRDGPRLGRLRVQNKVGLPLSLRKHYFIPAYLFSEFF